MSGEIDIADLIRPVMTPEQRAAVAAAEAAPPRLDVDSVLRAAEEATGLTDFGAPDFRPRLALWLSETAADEDLTALGRGMIFQMAATYAGNRLRVEDLVRRRPEILDIEIDRPLIVAGLPRSGTTHLQDFLSADPRLRELPMWEAACPVPGPLDQPTAEDPNPRRTRAIAAWTAFDALVPYTKAIHEMSPDHVSEDVELQSLAFGSYNIEWRVHAPRWRDACAQTDQTPIYRYLKKTLQVLTYLRGPNRWVLKCPQHMEQLGPLFRVFPDATVALIHRDPVASLQSALVGVCYISRITRRVIDADKISAYWLDRYERLLNRCVEDRDKTPPGRVVDVHFDDLMARPMGVVAQIYAAAGLEITAEVREAMAARLAANPRGKHGRLVYDLKRDFGFTAAEVRPRFARYLQRFQVVPEGVA
jgi:hypothetical protein